METVSKKFDLRFALFLAFSCLAVVLCYDFYFIPFMMILPALWATVAFRGKGGLPVFLLLSAFTVGYGLLIGYDFLFSLRMLILAAPPSVLLYISHKYRIGNTQAALYLSYAITFGLFAVFCLNSIRQGKDAFSEVRALFTVMLAPLENGLDAANPVLITFRDYVNNIDTYFPSVLYCFGAVFALANVLFLQLFNRRKKDMPLVPMRPFSQWRLPRPYVLVCVGVMAASLIISYTGSGRADTVLLLSNYMLNMPLSVVGAGMLYAIFTRNKTTALRTVIYCVLLIALILFGLALYTLSIIGFFGCMSVRRRDRQE